MYYPYFRAKRFELILLREQAGFLQLMNIHPIIEPVKNDLKALVRTIEHLSEKKLNCTIIINPQAGKTPVSLESICKQLIKEELSSCNNFSLGYILDASSNAKDLVQILEKYKNYSFTIIHYGYTESKALYELIKGYKNINIHVFIDGYAGKLYQRHFKQDGINRILIRNGFKSQIKNSLYPPSEHFSDLHITYPDENMDGFGDYTIVGDDYNETGGPAYAIAIHLTYLDNDDDMYIYHFVSDQTNSPTDPGGKFLEALAKLVHQVRITGSKILKTQACNEFIELYEKGHYPGLGYVKKLSMQHHIELLANYFEQGK